MLAKKIYLKATKLDPDLLSYLRAHLLVRYEGDNITKIKVTEPCDIDYELQVLEAYKCLLDLVSSLRKLFDHC